MSPFHRWYKARRACAVRAEGGWFLVGGHTHYFKSRFEVLVACHWQHMAELKIIHSWWYEPYTFKFNKSRGITEFCPDFEISHRNLQGRNENLLIECKGFVQDKDVRKIRQFVKDYPECKLMLMVQNLKRLFKSLEKWATAGRKTALMTLEALQEWEKDSSPVKLLDWTVIQKNNKYGLGLFGKATPVDKPVAGRGYNKRQILNLCKNFRLPHETPQDGEIDHPGAS
jgi:hypothetical protein